MASLAELDWSGFLGRPKIAGPAPESLEILRRTPVLVVGAGGSIGSALALRLAALGLPLLVLLEASESHLYALQRNWSEAGLTSPVVFVLGSVANPALLEEIFTVHAPGLVFHSAAFKQVPLLEEQPLAAIENNVFGTQCVVEASSGARVILLSTDKAVSPISVMGATKRAAEQIVLDSGGTVLRLGNVLASRDSVAEVFARQIAAGDPLTITEATACRYFLTIDEAVNLLLSAAAEPEPAALLAPELPATHRIIDLARFMVRELGSGRRIQIEFIGPRAGDKESERFWSATETARPARTRGLLSVESPLVSGEELRAALAGLRGALDTRDLAAALAQLRVLVPDYLPSAALMSLADRETSHLFS